MEFRKGLVGRRARTCGDASMQRGDRGDHAGPCLLREGAAQPPDTLFGLTKEVLRRSELSQRDHALGEVHARRADPRREPV